MNLENIPWLQIILGLGAIAVAILLINRIFPKRTVTTTTPAAATTPATPAAPAAPVRTYRSPEQWVGLALALILTLGFIAALAIFGPELATKASKRAEAYQPPPPDPAKVALTERTLDDKLHELDQFELEKEIEIAKVRFDHTYDIPPAEIDKQLQDAGGIPGSLFRLNMIQRYGFKDLPLMMHDLPSSAVEVRKMARNTQGNLVQNSYYLFIPVRKGSLTRPIRIASWADTFMPTDKTLSTDYKIVCDPGRSDQATFVCRKDSHGNLRYWQELGNGNWKKMPSNWHPKPTHSYSLSLLDDYPQDCVEYRIFRVRKDL